MNLFLKSTPRKIPVNQRFSLFGCKRCKFL
nr:MAG TPA: hypothetical protein [Caudoviricetes sp.]